MAQLLIYEFQCSRVKTSIVNCTCWTEESQRVTASGRNDFLVTAELISLLEKELRCLSSR